MSLSHLNLTGYQNANPRAQQQGYSNRPQLTTPQGPPSHQAAQQQYTNGPSQHRLSQIFDNNHIPRQNVGFPMSSLNFRSMVDHRGVQTRPQAFHHSYRTGNQVSSNQFPGPSSKSSQNYSTITMSYHSPSINSNYSALPVLNSGYNRPQKLQPSHPSSSAPFVGSSGYNAPHQAQPFNPNFSAPPTHASHSNGDYLQHQNYNHDLSDPPMLNAAYNPTQQQYRSYTGSILRCKAAQVHQTPHAPQGIQAPQYSTNGVMINGYGSSIYNRGIGVTGYPPPLPPYVDYSGDPAADKKEHRQNQQEKRRIDQGKQTEQHGGQKRPKASHNVQAPQCQQPRIYSQHLDSAQIQVCQPRNQTNSLNPDESSLFTPQPSQDVPIQSIEKAELQMALRRLSKRDFAYGAKFGKYNYLYNMSPIVTPEL